MPVDVTYPHIEKIEGSSARLANAAHSRRSDRDRLSQPRQELLCLQLSKLPWK